MYTFNRATVRELDKLREKDLKLPTISIGYAYYDHNYENALDSIAEADRMMYLHKKTKKKTTEMTGHGRQRNAFFYLLCPVCLHSCEKTGIIRKQENFNKL